MEISFAWWNTSLSPSKSGKNRATDDDKLTALEVLAELILTQKADMIGLCEIQQSDIDRISPICAQHGYLVQGGIEKAGRSAFDMCVVYNAKKFALIKQNFILYEKLKRTSKVASYMLFRIVADGSDLHVFTSHWPSRLKDSALLRNELGRQLRMPISSILKSDLNSLILVMGDFNDEPFNESLANHMMATRDRELAGKTQQLLYNPFWRHIGSRDHYHHSTPITNRSGTCYYVNDDIDRWRTFDQIIVSSAFVGNSQWHLRESSVEIIDLSNYTVKVLDPQGRFDHFPIKIAIEKVV